MALSLCKICGESHDYQSGFFTRHLLNTHEMSLEDYVVATEYNGIAPKCSCDYCDLRPSFVRGKFKVYAHGHIGFDYLKEMYLQKYGIPKCPTCSEEIKSWHRGYPRKYCSHKCQSGNWNQEKIKETIRERYGVDNVFQIPSIIEANRFIDRNADKSLETKKQRYENGAFDPDKMKESMMEKYGVEHPSQILKNRVASSERMIDENPMFNVETIKKQVKTLMTNLISGKTKLFRTKKYNDTELYYQSSYELDFLKLCESKGILKDIANGNSYPYLQDDSSIGFRMLTDFCMNDVEIEIKSSYIMKKQGGLRVLNAKRRAVEFNGKKYVVILDKDYSEFLEIIK